MYTSLLSRVVKISSLIISTTGKKHFYLKKGSLLQYLCICWLFLRLMMFLFYKQENLFLINVNVIFSICHSKITFNMWVKFCKSNINIAFDGKKPSDNFNLIMGCIKIYEDLHVVMADKTKSKLGKKNTFSTNRFRPNCMENLASIFSQNISLNHYLYRNWQIGLAV